jgi:hypothetical protein
MTLWVLEVDTGYGDGRAVLGVFSTKEAAMDAAPRAKKWIDGAQASYTDDLTYHVATFTLDEFEG